MTYFAATAGGGAMMLPFEKNLKNKRIESADTVPKDLTFIFWSTQKSGLSLSGYKGV